jgi:hypothetical protein
MDNHTVEAMLRMQGEGFHFSIENPILQIMNIGAQTGPYSNADEIAAGITIAQFDHSNLVSSMACLMLLNARYYIRDPSTNHV